MQAATQVDLAPDDNDVSVITSLLLDHRKLGEVLWQCCRRQAESQSVDRSSFLAALDGDALTAGWGALVDAVVGFIQSRSPKHGESIRLAIEAEMKGMELGAISLINILKSKTTDDAIQRAIKKIERDMTAELESAFADSATS